MYNIHVPFPNRLRRTKRPQMPEPTSNGSISFQKARKLKGCIIYLPALENLKSLSPEASVWCETAPQPQANQWLMRVDGLNVRPPHAFAWAMPRSQLQPSEWFVSSLTVSSQQQIRLIWLRPRPTHTTWLDCVSRMSYFWNTHRRRYENVTVHHLPI